MAGGNAGEKETKRLGSGHRGGQEVVESVSIERYVQG